MADEPRITSFGSYETSDADLMRPTLRRIGALIGKELPAGWGFNLLLFTYGEGGSLFYISSAERADVINVMKEYIAKFEREQA